MQLISKLIFNYKDQNLTVNLGNSSPEINIRDLVRKILKKMDREDINLFDLNETEGSPKRRAPNIDLLNDITRVTDRVSIDDGLDLTIKWYLKFLKNFN